MNNKEDSENMRSKNAVSIIDSGANALICALLSAKKDSVIAWYGDFSEAKKEAAAYEWDLYALIKKSEAKAIGIASPNCPEAQKCVEAAGKRYIPLPEDLRRYGGLTAEEEKKIEREKEGFQRCINALDKHLTDANAAGKKRLLEELLKIE